MARRPRRRWTRRSRARPDDVRRLAAVDGLAELDARASASARACPRLVEWRERGRATTKRASFARPALLGPADRRAGVTDRAAQVARSSAWRRRRNGGNRTGRVFTGDSLGRLAVRLAAPGRPRRAGRRASTPGDGQRLVGTRMVATVRCAPPANKPTTGRAGHLSARGSRAGDRARRDAVRVVVALGGFGWDGALRALAAAGYVVPRPQPEVRPRRRGRSSASRDGGTADAPRLLPPQPAEHLHRPPDPERCSTTSSAGPPRCAPSVIRSGRPSDHFRWRPGAPLYPNRLEEVALKAIQSGFESQRGHHAGSRGLSICCTNGP